MMYFGIFVGLFALRLICDRNRALHTLCYFIAIVFLFSFVAFRYRVGCDWGSYNYQLNTYANLTISEAIVRKEQFYWFLIMFVNWMEWQYFAFNCLVAGVFFAGIHLVARRQPDPIGYLILTFPILVVGIPMSATRQALAIGVLCAALNAFVDRRLFLYVALCIAAALFHTTAIAFLTLTPFILFGLNDNRVYWAGLTSLAIVTYVLTGDTVDQYTNLYVGTVHDAAGGPVRAGLLFVTAIWFFFWIRDRWRVLSPNDYSLVFIGSGLMIMNFGLVFISSVMGDRFGYYLNLIQLIIMSKAYLMLSQSHKGLPFYLPYLVTGGALLGWTQLSGIFQLCYANYQTW